MSITSLSFFVFIFGLLFAYYIVPKRFQWVILLIASLLFYVSNSISGIFYVLITASSSYIATRWISKIYSARKEYFKANGKHLSREEKSQIKQKAKRSCKRIMIGTLLLNFGILCVFKYCHFALDQLNSILSVFGGPLIEDNLHLIIPLGISFYTFQTMGYVVDVYWENCRAEKNYFKTLLFVCFFPQVTQGPISDFEQLSNELFTKHTFSYRGFSRGFQRMLWGFMKKMVLANILAPYVQDVFSNYSQYTGISVFIGALCYSVQIYADFSGYMDIMCGICEMLGIRLTENFNRPYFSKSIAEYWRRWHISLGTWFKKYIYYPIAVAKWNRKLGNTAQQRVGKHFGQTLPATFALVLVWLTTGLWHGASWAYIAWGGVNGLIIIFSLWLEPVYAKGKTSLHINEHLWIWRAFQVLRTFLLVTFIKVLPEVGSLSDGFGLLKRIFTNFSIPGSLREMLPFVDMSSSTGKMNFAIVLFFTALLFISSLLQRKKPVRDYFNRLPMLIRLVLLCMLVIIIAYLGVQASWSEGGFMYENF